MIEQSDPARLNEVCLRDEKGHLLATFIGNWDNTQEGYLFWSDIAARYWFNQDTERTNQGSIHRSQNPVRMNQQIQQTDVTLAHVGRPRPPPANRRSG